MRDIYTPISLFCDSAMQIVCFCLTDLIWPHFVKILAIIEFFCKILLSATYAHANILILPIVAPQLVCLIEVVSATKGVTHGATSLEKKTNSSMYIFVQLQCHTGKHKRSIPKLPCPCNMFDSELESR